jgi:replicative DNA helicase
MEAAINSQNLRSGELSPQEWARFVHAAGNMSNFKIYIDDTPAMSPLQMRTKCLRLAREHGIDLIVVDYMQLMNAGGVYENNRVQEISYISRSMKEMARELNVPVLSAAQLSRAVEQRQDKRPVLSDLRESGCLAGESLVYLPDTGQHVPIRDLCGRVGFRVLSLNTDTWKLEPGLVTNAFCTGVKPVYRLTTGLGRSIRATANHKFLTIHGWKRLDALGADDCVAVPQPVSDFGAKSQLTTENTEVTETGIRPLGSPACRPDTDGLYGAPVCDAGHKQPLEIISMSASPSVFSVSSVVKKFALISECTPNFSQSDVYWDTIVAIEPEGETEVYDLTVPGNSNFIGNGLCLHNSIEQDADVVMFLYRDEVYNEATEFPNQAEVIIAKHRNGPTGAISLYFEKTLTKFMNAAERSVDLSHI